MFFPTSNSSLNSHPTTLLTQILHKTLNTLKKSYGKQTYTTFRLLINRPIKVVFINLSFLPPSARIGSI